ncbi:MAG TPA: hypothetical protein VN704_08090 [Verrucomicrobiae bacterium]|nr:hypothetical protein [Verrucomicrobiae bacterium]
MIVTINFGSHPFGVGYNSINGVERVTNFFDNIFSVIAHLAVANAGSNQILQSFQTDQLNDSSDSSNRYHSINISIDSKLKSFLIIK